jgi:hypothetical protein
VKHFTESVTVNGRRDYDIETHIHKEKLYKFICTCRGRFVSSVAATGAGAVKMAAARAEKAFRMLEHAATQSIVAVQRRFRTKFGNDLPVRKSVKQWHEKFQRDCWLCIVNRPVRPGRSEECVELVEGGFSM